MSGSCLSALRSLSLPLSLSVSLSLSLSLTHTHTHTHTQKHRFYRVFWGPGWGAPLLHIAVLGVYLDLLGAQERPLPWVERRVVAKALAD
jgi:hypothetical protein